MFFVIAIGMHTKEDDKRIRRENFLGSKVEIPNELQKHLQREPFLCQRAPHTTLTVTLTVTLTATLTVTSVPSLSPRISRYY